MSAALFESNPKSWPADHAPYRCPTCEWSGFVNYSKDKKKVKYPTKAFPANRQYWRFAYLCPECSEVLIYTGKVHNVGAWNLFYEPRLTHREWLTGKWKRRKAESQEGKREAFTKRLSEILNEQNHKDYFEGWAP